MAKTLEKLVKGDDPPERVAKQLADLLVESLDADDLGRIDRLWTTEAKRRRDEVRNGHVETMPGVEALRFVRDSLGR